MYDMLLGERPHPESVSPINRQKTPNAIKAVSGKMKKEEEKTRVCFIVLVQSMPKSIFQVIVSLFPC